MNAPLNFQEMAKRDPAMAALMGAIPGYDFGYSEPSQQSYQAPAPAFQYGAQFGDDQYGYGEDVGYGYGYGADGFGATAAVARRQHPGHPAPRPQLVRPLAHPASTEARTFLLDPNRGSTVKVERYSFSFSPAATIDLGTVSAIASFTQQPSASIKGQRLIMNAPVLGMVLVNTLQIANVNVFIGTTEDAGNYNNVSQGVHLDLPRLDPQNRATCSGNYTGVLPPGYTAGFDYTFIVTLQGPATLAGGYGQ